MFVILMSFYLMNSIAVLSVIFSHIFPDQINFVATLEMLHIFLKLNVSLVSPRTSCNAETRVYGLDCMCAHIMRFRDINLRRLD